MALSQGNKAEWVDIRALFNRANAERVRWGKNAIARPNMTNQTITLTELNNLKAAIQELAAISFLSSAASTSNITTPKQGDLITADYPTSLGAVIQRVENTTVVKEGYQYTSFAEAFQFEAHGTGFQFEAHGTGFEFTSHGTGFEFTSHGTGFQFTSHGVGGTVSFSGHNEGMACFTFQFGSSRNGSPDTSESPFCASGTFTNHSRFTAAHGGSTVFEFTSHGVGGTRFDAHGNGGRYFSAHGVGGRYFSAHAEGGNYFTTFNAAGFCRSHNGADFFNSI